MNELGLEDEFVSDRLGTTHRAIDVFRTGEFQGTYNEQQRIIKLLEGLSCGHYCRCMNNELCDVYAEAIELIKGEQK